MLKNRNVSQLLEIIHTRQSTILALLVLCIGLAMYTHNVLKELSVVLITSSITSELYQIFVRGSFLRTMREQIREEIAQGLTENEQLRRLGVVNAFPSLTQSNLYQELANAVRSIRILQTWPANKTDLARLVADAIENNRCHVQILLLAPESEMARARSVDLGLAPETVPNAISETLAELGSYFKRRGVVKSVEIRLYELTPVLVLYAWDDSYYLGLFWQGMASLQGPQLQIKDRDSEYGRTLDDHFNTIWNHETTKSYSLS